MFNTLTNQELTAVRSSIRNSIELYNRYVALNPEHDATPWLMKRKQGQLRRKLGFLQSALGKLKNG